MIQRASSTCCSNGGGGGVAIIKAVPSHQVSEPADTLSLSLSLSFSLTTIFVSFRINEKDCGEVMVAATEHYSFRPGGDIPQSVQTELFRYSN